MKQYVSDPVQELNHYLLATINKFDFERPGICVSRSTPDTGHDIDDLDIYDGLYVGTPTYARVARHIPTGTVCLITSKAPENLRGERSRDKKKIIATNDGLQKSYIVSAYRSSGKDNDIYRVARKLRRDLKRYSEDLEERCEKHFTLYGARIGNPDPGTRRFNANTPTEIWTNGRIAYLLDQNKDGQWEVRFYAPTRRRDGSFVPVDISSNRLRDKFARVTRLVATSDSYEEAREKVAGHWQLISSRLWDEESIYKSEGWLMHIMRVISQAVNKVRDKGLRLAFVTSAVGLTLGLISPKYGIIGGLTAAAIHTAMDHIADESYIGSQQAIKELNEARRRLNIEAYPFDENAANHYKIQTRPNISKLCPKIDLERFPAEEFEFLDSERSGLLRDHEFAVDGFRPQSIKDQILSMHQRGFSSTCVLPDSNTRVDMFQSGLVRLMHQMPDGNIRIFAGYRPDNCIDENLRLPQNYIDQLGQGVIALTYDRKRSNFNHAFTVNSPSLDEILAEIEPLLFRDQPEITDGLKVHSLDSIKNIFAGCIGIKKDEPDEPFVRYPALPDLRAMMAPGY